MVPISKKPLVYLHTALGDDQGRTRKIRHLGSWHRGYRTSKVPIPYIEMQNPPRAFPSNLSLTVLVGRYCVVLGDCIRQSRGKGTFPRGHQSWPTIRRLRTPSFEVETGADTHSQTAPVTSPPYLRTKVVVKRVASH